MVNKNDRFRWYGSDEHDAEIRKKSTSGLLAFMVAVPVVVSILVSLWWGMFWLVRMMILSIMQS